MVALRTEAELEKIRNASRIVGEVLKGIGERIKPGVTTRALDLWAEKFIVARGGRPAFKGYRGFPGTLCTSINEQVVHGIPGPRKLRQGDLLSLDVGVEWQGWFGDAAWTFAVGEVSDTARRLMTVTREALELGMIQARAGRKVSDIGHAVQLHVEAAGFSVVRDYVGHGIGQALHEEPQIPNYGDPDQGVRLKPGMVLAIEPMVNVGGFAVNVLRDQWTVVTQDGSLSAHFEHTVAVREGEPEVLTR